MPETRPDTILSDVKTSSPSAFAAAVAIIALVACALGLPMFTMMVEANALSVASAPSEVGTAGSSLASGSRDIVTMLVALLGITVLAWRRTLRLSHRRSTPVRVEGPRK